MTFRPLTILDKTAIESVLNSRREQALVGVSWTVDSILDELLVSGSLGRFAPDAETAGLQAFILFKDLGSVVEILLIYSRMGSKDSASEILKALLDAYSQFDEVWLEVHEENKVAIRFYERQGFLRVFRRRNYYSDGKAALNYNLSLKP
jgi:GNAT superfamily N-acetyltransferase